MEDPMVCKGVEHITIYAIEISSFPLHDKDIYVLIPPNSYLVCVYVPNEEHLYRLKKETNLSFLRGGR